MTATRTALITGGARGIGLAIARGLLDAGHRVAVADSDKAALDLADIDAIKLAADVTSPADCRRAVAEAAEGLGAVDVLVNNAGIGMGLIREAHFTEPVRLADITPEHWHRFFAVNCAGPFLMAQAATPGMLERGWGRVVNVTTSFFTMLNIGFAPYGPSKAALEAASAIWAKEFDGTGVTVNVVVPGGPTDTRMVPEATGFVRESLIPVAAMVPPIRWLASEASDGVSGRRFVGALWDAARDETEAAEAAGAPVAWPGLTANVVWPE